MTSNDTESENIEEKILIVPVEPNPLWKKNAEKLVEGSLSPEKNVTLLVTIGGFIQGIFSIQSLFPRSRVHLLIRF